MEKTSLNVFKYYDYREALFAIINNLKTEKKISMRTVARNAGFSPGFLPQVLSGDKNLSHNSALKLVSVFELADADQSYFLWLVKLSESNSQKERINALKQLLRFHDFKNQSPQEAEVYQYLSNWYYVAIRELVATDNFKEDIKWIQKQLFTHVPAPNIKKALEFLERNNFISRNKAGRLVQSNKNVHCDGGIFRLVLGQFHRNMLELASQSIDRCQRDQRSLTGFTFSIPINKFNEVREILATAEKKLADLDTQKVSADSVYHVCLAAFPLAGKKVL